MVRTTSPTRAETLGEHTAALLRLGLPLIGSNLATFAIGLTDTLMLGWYDVTALAAATLANSLYFVLFLMGTGFAWAVAPLVAAAAATHDEAQIRLVTRMGLWIAVIYGLVMLAPQMGSAQIFLALDQDPAVSALAQEYLRIASWAMIPALMMMVLRAFLSALEHTAIILWATLGAAVVNGALNYALIFGRWGAPELGVAGAALATVASATLSLLVLLGYALWKRPEYRLLRKLWRLDPGALARVFRLGLPIGLTSLAESGLFSVSAVMIGWLGAVELAAHGIALQLASAAYMPHLGLSQAATVRAGQATGRRDEGALRRVGAAAILLSVASATAAVTLFVLAPHALISLFLTPGEPARLEILAVGAALLQMAAVFNLMDGMQVIALGLLRGVQDTTAPMLHAVISYWLIGLPVGYAAAFVLGRGASGIWLGLVAGLASAAVLLMVRFWQRSVRIGAT